MATDEHVSDRATGKPLRFDVVGQDAATAGGVRGSDSTQMYIRVILARPVPADGGEAQMLIDKTYRGRDEATSPAAISIVFTRPLGIKRNAVVLPAGYGRSRATIRRRCFRRRAGGWGSASGTTRPPRPRSHCVRCPRVGCPPRIPHRALIARSPHGWMSARIRVARSCLLSAAAGDATFDLYHDYTESRASTSTYINEVRPWSTVAKPSARNLDTGEDLQVGDPQRGCDHPGQARREGCDTSKRGGGVSLCAGGGGRLDAHSHVRDVH